MKKYFWDLFENTGNIEAYLAYREMSDSRQGSKRNDTNERSQGQGHCY